jgi:hypothetical protein
VSSLDVPTGFKLEQRVSIPHHLSHDSEPPLLRFPKTNTASNAAHAAITANISGLLASLNPDIDTISKEIKIAMRLKLIRSLVTRYNATIAASRSKVAPTIPMKMTRCLTVRDA